MADAIVHNPEPAPQNRRPSAQRSASSITQQDEPPVRKVTPRPTYISSTNESEIKLPQQLLSRKESIDLDDYFVRPTSDPESSSSCLFVLT